MSTIMTPPTTKQLLQPLQSLVKKFEPKAGALLNMTLERLEVVPSC